MTDLSARPLPPVCRSAEELRAELSSQPDVLHCVYLGHRADWSDSTSYRYMNAVDERFRYVPIDIALDGDIAGVVDVVATAPNVLGFNITSPFKDHSVIRSRCADPVPDSVNFVLRNGEHFVGYELNGHAFVNWLERAEGPVAGKTAIICGAGGSGLAIAARLAERGVAITTLVDPADRSSAVARVPRAQWVPSLDDVDPGDAELLVVLALPRGSEDPRQLDAFLREHRSAAATFVDIRVDSDETAELARRAGWNRSYNGNGMNEHNDLAMIKMLFDEQTRRNADNAFTLNDDDFLALVQEVERVVQSSNIERLPE